MNSEEQPCDIVCPSEEDLLCYEYQKACTCPVPDCGKVIKNRSSMKMHMAQTHGIGDETDIKRYNKAFFVPATKTKYACPVSTCSRKLGSGKYFSGMTVLREHYLCSHAEKKHICGKCTAKFGNPKSLQKHLKICGQIFHCTCGCPFKKKTSLLMHSIKSQHQLPDDVKQDFILRGQKAQDSGNGQPRPLAEIINPQLVLQSQQTKNQQKKDREPARQVLVLPGNPQIPTSSYLVILGGTKPQEGTIDRPNKNLVIAPSNSMQKEKQSSHSNVTESQNESVWTVSREQIDGNTRRTESTESTSNNVNFSAKSQHSTTYTPINGEIDTRRGTSSCMEKFSLERKQKCPVNNQGMLDNKLKRVNEAMQKFVPIMKKEISSPVTLRNWETSRRSYTKRKQDQKKPNIVNDPESRLTNEENVQNGESSLLSIQDCMQKAKQFLNQALPRIQSPKRLRDGESHSQKAKNSANSAIKLQKRFHGPSRRDVKHQDRQVEKSFERCCVSVEDVGETNKDDDGIEMISDDERPNGDNSSNWLNHQNRMKLQGNGLSNFEQLHVKDNQSGTNLALNEYSLDDLSQDLLFFLKNTSEILNKRNCGYTSANQTNNQETQTSVNTATEKYDFQHNYDDLTALENSDIQTQTDHLSGLLSDAFTQTCQAGMKSATRFSNSPTLRIKEQIKELSTKEFLESTWLTSNNETQTDNLHDLLTDAFTQTKCPASENQSVESSTADNSIADNHTQTNLSFDNFLTNFCFENMHQTPFDATIIPDFADMCTQTNLDSGFKDFLTMASMEGQRVSSSLSNLQAESSNCHTQTSISFDDLFESSFSYQADAFNADREIINSCTQTIMDDIFLTDNFTQTQIQ